MRASRSRDLRALIVLALVAAAAGSVQRARPPVPRTEPPAPAASTAPAPAGATLPAEVTWEVAPRLPRDPFELAPLPQHGAPRRRRTAAQPEPPPPQPGRVPRVRILLLDPQRPLALLDDRRVAVGDTIAGYRVVGIEAAGVTLERGGARITARP